MKNKFCFLQLLFLICSLFSFSQTNIKVAPKLISLKQSKFSIGANLEGGIMTGGSNTTGLNIVYKDPRATQSVIAYQAAGFVFDLYSANSIVGFLGGFDYANFKYGLRKGDSTTDYFDNSSVEIPFYLKFRFGASGSKKHVCFLLGGVYSIPTTAKRDQFNSKDGNSAFAILTDDNKDQLKSYFALSGGLGYEFFLLGEEKHVRVAFYSRIVYPISNELDANYVAFKSNGNSVLKSYPNFDIKQYRISLGLKIMLQFGEAAKIMADAATKK